ncbi:Hypothetical protein EUBELI_00856 [Lachnospira eligens ATCC 27750]|uniref:Uncharacterized protein n=1 Tax=Lachnospira eligens (strain ATCC 27750 / DSM 3376 / VPI C15-48 / C15-B4) TaxID=515620 RepID=C4Z5K5_LACE2|nr:Hypothetical protein EUBELI_00856 [[Eubacterium] eligens ATCC 27750]
MDVNVERRHMGVQNGSCGAVDWTLERREGMLKSKREAKILRIGH